MGPFVASRRVMGTGKRSSMGLAGRDFALLIAATLGTFSNYAPLLSVVSLWVAGGGSGHGGVGAATGVTMATTVGVQLVMGPLLRRYELRRLLAVGALLLGAPTFAYPFSSGLEWVLGVSAVRGVGFGMVAVAGSALVAELVPAHQRGRAVGRYGIAVGLPQVVCLPVGVWSAQRFGFTAIFVVTGALSVLAAPLAGLMSGRVEEDTPDRGRSSARADSSHPVAGLRPLSGPWVMLIVAACAVGGVTAFLPLALEGGAAAPTALFMLSAAVIVGRWAAGVFSDRAGAGRLLVPGVLACTLGTAGFALAISGLPGLAWAAAVLYGLGFGALQNDTLVVMFHRVGRSGHGMASTAWNMAYDAGTGVGAVAVGMVSQVLGVGGGFAAAAVLIALVSPLAWRERRAEATRRGTPALAHES
ncbi:MULTISPECIES: MFS transporter [Streptomyces]|uniref:MFS transporter n=1 Tax=Streptomyces lycopersici TaxID=2974589 RepID=UPI0021D34E0D|nr:MFS transporter [Streptomyces sp. NEAU-383]